ncbi:transcriptional regulator [Pseudalgibacter alginicilyticus]|uniref:Transcriptional regulator n=1 Tax=Pseudalgibacter alginicilyticus TaxID=1736674 RepID=A0A0P0DEM6_9FLAO|nr:response regulator [Pseudalgibacter alginicilyticus]ALJ06508.1 transcriptional regulator [Pseudalgibacter alginicilyticus]
MFEKVLIVDDHDVVNEGVKALLKGLDILNIHKAQYCDEAVLIIKRAIIDEAPFDLLITDLSFKKDYHSHKLHSGEDLIASIRPDFPALKIIVYSMEDRLQKVRTLVNTFQVNAYVCKGRNGAAELSKAIEQIGNHKTYLSPQIENALHANNDLEVDDYDIELVKLLSLGLSQNEISKQFEQRQISPSSLSSVEKRLNKLKDLFKANNAIHLVSITKDLGLI